MGKFEFDKNGHLVPYDIIETSVHELKLYFVDNMKERELRNSLFEGYMNYNSKLMSLIKCNYVQWIDGSFVTKTLKPNDVDMVTFIN